MYYGRGTGANVARQAAKPMYPFGYGLSYTTFAYSNASINSTQASCTITNTGSRKGAEVVQVYVSFPGSSISHRPTRKLVGFDRVELEPGESKVVTIPIREQELAYFDDDSHTWKIEGGTVNVYISAASDDDRLTGSFTTTAQTLAQSFLSRTTLDEADDDVLVVGGKTNITLKRTIKADQWNTIVLPFAVPSVEALFGADTKVAGLTSVEGNVLNFTSANSMEANKPYMIKVATNFSSKDIDDVTLVETIKPNFTYGNVTFVGTYKKQNIPVEAYFVSDNKLYKASDATNTIRPFRAYITTAGTSSASELTFVIDGNVTAIADVRSKAEGVKGNIYDLQGRQVEESGKGVYIINGKKQIK